MRDHDREKLLVLEHQLLADDPLWALSFHAGQRRLRVPAQERLSREARRELRQVLYGTAGFFAAMFGLAVLALSVTAGLFLVVVAGILIWMTIRVRQDQ
jgi:Flp pilus assembly protein TadB